ncbi:hypothetical protein GGU11DRAFT_760066 [Lentinula aff. detonsa]|nr:hypothetical protein GGU11DRAFT_760066 [Lentinula aff. detonsa]
MPIRVGIALYYVAGLYGAPSYFHWILVASSADTWAPQPILALELKKTFSTYIQSFTHCDVLRSTAFTGIVHLFTTTRYTPQTFYATIKDNFPATDPGWRFPGIYGPQGWTCATWILQILWRMREEGTWVSDRNFDRTYTRVLNLGSELIERTENVEYQGGAFHTTTMEAGVFPHTTYATATSLVKAPANCIRTWLAVVLCQKMLLGESTRKLYQDMTRYCSLSKDAGDPLIRLESGKSDGSQSPETSGAHTI